MRSLFLAGLCLAISAGGAAAKPASATNSSSPYLYTASIDKNKEVLVDIDADRSVAGAPSLLVFFLFAKPVNGHEVWIYNYQFDCPTGTAAIVQQTEDSKNIEPLNLRDVAPIPYPVPVGSFLRDVLNVACNGRSAFPAKWRPTALNLRQASRWYYETYLGERF